MGSFCKDLKTRIRHEPLVPTPRRENLDTSSTNHAPYHQKSSTPPLNKARLEIHDTGLYIRTITPLDS
uniref:Uncharacterized protein n=1 Tax=Arundo donax TaxID=35708 RepID=A0A0A9ASQ5_ARUDO